MIGQRKISIDRITPLIGLAGTATSILVSFSLMSPGRTWEAVLAGIGAAMVIPGVGVLVLILVHRSRRAD